MKLIHTPARTVTHPDRFTDPQTGRGFSVYPDLCAPDPRLQTDESLVAVHVFSAGHGSNLTKVPANLAAGAFAHYFDQHDEADALALTHRYLAAFHPDTPYALATAQVHGDTQGDWLRVFAACAPGYGDPAAHIETYAAWAFGRVWEVAPDQESPLTGIYAADPQQALEVYLHDNQALDPPQPPARGFVVRWQVDVDITEAASPEQAAAQVWSNTFARCTAGPGDACVFTVVETATGHEHQVDLAAHDLEALLNP